MRYDACFHSYRTVETGGIEWPVVLRFPLYDTYDLRPLWAFDEITNVEAS